MPAGIAAASVRSVGDAWFPRRDAQLVGPTVLFIAHRGTKRLPTMVGRDGGCSGQGTRATSRIGSDGRRHELHPPSSPLIVTTVVPRGSSTKNDIESAQSSP